MKRYLAFLRGINVSGKNILPMAELKKSFEKLEFKEVRTYLNSGNIAFSADLCDPGPIRKQIEKMILEQFGLDIPVLVLAKEALEDILQHAPDWWGSEDRAIYDNLIFVIPPATSPEIWQALGDPKEGLEKAEVYGNAIFWSFSREAYQKTNWWPKTAGLPVRDKITVRTAGTVRKAAGL